VDSNAVPQDNVSTLANRKKAIYATSETGEYSIVASSGWQVEAEATIQALQELERLSDAAYESVVAGAVSPLGFHMYNQRMDLATLAQASGIYKWRLKRHLKPSIFARLPQRLLGRYADTLGLSIKELCELPPRGVPGA